MRGDTIGGPKPARRVRTTRPHTRSFGLAPSVRAGERVQFIRHDERHRGWFFGRAVNGVEGYFPADWFRIDPVTAQATALRDYDAMELSVEAGEDVECLAEAAGWLLVRTADDREGWIPAESFE